MKKRYIVILALSTITISLFSMDKIKEEKIPYELQGVLNLSPGNNLFIYSNALITAMRNKDYQEFVKQRELLDKLEQEIINHYQHSSTVYDALTGVIAIKRKDIKPFENEIDSKLTSGLLKNQDAVFILKSQHFTDQHIQDYTYAQRAVEDLKTTIKNNDCTSFLACFSQVEKISASKYEQDQQWLCCCLDTIRQRGMNAAYNFKRKLTDYALLGLLEKNHAISILTNVCNLKDVCDLNDVSELNMNGTTKQNSIVSFIVNPQSFHTIWIKGQQKSALQRQIKKAKKNCNMQLLWAIWCQNSIEKKLIADMVFSHLNDNEIHAFFQDNEENACILYTIAQQSKRYRIRLDNLMKDRRLGVTLKDPQLHLPLISYSVPLVTTQSTPVIPFTGGNNNTSPLVTHSQGVLPTTFTVDKESWWARITAPHLCIGAVVVACMGYYGALIYKKWQAKKAKRLARNGKKDNYSTVNIEGHR